MIVYVVHYTSYDGAWIQDVFKCNEDAERCASELNKDLNLKMESYDVEEFEVK